MSTHPPPLSFASSASSPLQIAAQVRQIRVLRTEALSQDWELPLPPTSHAAFALGASAPPSAGSPGIIGCQSASPPLNAHGCHGHRSAGGVQPATRTSNYHAHSEPTQRPSLNDPMQWSQSIENASFPLPFRTTCAHGARHQSGLPAQETHDWNTWAETPAEPLPSCSPSAAKSAPASLELFLSCSPVANYMDIFQAPNNRMNEIFEAHHLREVGSSRELNGPPLSVEERPSRRPVSGLKGRFVRKLSHPIQAKYSD